MKAPPKHTANRVWLTSSATPMKEYLDLLMQARRSLVVMRSQAISDLWSPLISWLLCAAGMYCWFRCLSLLFSVLPSSLSGSFRQGHIVRDFSSHLALSMNWPINVECHWSPSTSHTPISQYAHFCGEKECVYELHDFVRAYSVSVCLCLSIYLSLYVCTIL